MSLDLAGGGRLLFAGAGQAWVWGVSGAVVLVLLLVLHREERKLVSRGVGLFLLILRLAAAAVLVLALFEPIAAWTRVETVRGKVVVAADLSESMATIDADRKDGRPRREVARSLLSGETAPLPKLAGDHDVAALGFARSGTPEGTAETLAELLAKPGAPDDPTRQTTDPAPAFEAALRTPDDKPVTGIVLLTDGRFNPPGGETASTVDRLKARGIPVYPILIGSTAPLKDAAIVSVKAPEAVYKGDVATVDALVKADGFPVGSTLNVTLARPGLPSLEKQVVVPADGGRPVASFRLPMDKTGDNPLTVSVAIPPGDLRPDNNSRSLQIQVADDKSAVLLVDGEARWEFRYLRNALARDPRVKLDAILLRQPPPTGSIETSYPSSLPALPRTADAVDPLGAFDIVIVGDLGPADASTEFWERIGKYVGERGGTLVLSPGPRGWPAVLSSSETARALSPVIDPRLVPIDKEEDAAHPSLPPGAKLSPVPAALDDPATWPMLQLGGDLPASRAVWSGLPRLPWALGGAAKPTATVLLTAGDGTPIVAAQPFGLGKVLWVGTDGTWRWRFGVGDLHHHRFWGQVVRWASAQGLTAGDRFVRFGPVRSRIGEGESTTVKARISEAAPQVGPGFLLAARIYPVGGSPDKAAAVVPLRASPGQPRSFEAALPPLSEGAYRVRLDAPGLPAEPGAAPAEANLVVTARDTSERVELSAARDPLERLAAATGGKVFDESTANQIPALLKSRVKTETKTEEIPLWDHPAGLILFFALLTVEWIVRRKVGLP